MLLLALSSAAWATIPVVNLMAEATWTLGARVPIGLALGVEGGAGIGYSAGVDLLAYGELDLPAGQPLQLVTGVRVGPTVLYGYGASSQVSAHFDAGWSWRFGAWSGPRLGGDLRVLYFRTRYTTMIDVRRPVAPSAELPLPRWGVDPLQAHTLGFGMAVMPYDAYAPYEYY